MYSMCPNKHISRLTSVREPVGLPQTDPDAGDETYQCTWASRPSSERSRRRWWGCRRGRCAGCSCLSSTVARCMSPSLSAPDRSRDRCDLRCPCAESVIDDKSWIRKNVAQVPDRKENLGLAIIGLTPMTPFAYSTRCHQEFTYVITVHHFRWDQMDNFFTPPSAGTWKCCSYKTECIV